MTALAATLLVFAVACLALAVVKQAGTYYRGVRHGRDATLREHHWAGPTSVDPTVLRRTKWPLVDRNVTATNEHNWEQSGEIRGGQR